MTKKERDRQIADIMTNFNFRSTCKMMAAVGWLHHDRPVTVSSLKALAIRLLNEVQNNCTSSYGGLRASWDNSEYGCWRLSLEFVGEEYVAEVR